MNHFERPFSLFTLPTSSSTHSLINQDIRESISEMKSVSKLAKDSQELYCLNPNSTKAEFLTVVEKCRLENDSWQVNLGAGMAVLRLILSHWGRTEVESDLIASILDGKFISNEVTGTSADQICSSIL